MKISCTALLHTAEATASRSSALVVTLPKSASAQLPSRGMVMVAGTLNNFPLQAVLEPDGQGSHWFILNQTIREATGTGPGDTVILALEAIKNWSEPKVPADLQHALAADAQAHARWQDITPQARWDWIRWISAAKQAETRRRRVESVGSRLKAGKRRPCCFNRTQCTLTEA
jgi:hypothetical protein